MNQQQAESTTHFIDDGQLNRVLGWAMLLTGLALAAVLDPWFFAAQSAKEFANSMRPSTRHAQGVVLGMALMQLAMAHLIWMDLSRAGSRIVSVGRFHASKEVSVANNDEYWATVDQTDIRELAIA